MKREYGSSYSCLQGSGGYAEVSDREVRESRTPSLTSKVIFTKAKQLIQKNALVKALCDAHNHDYCHGYMNSTIAHHTNLGRLARYRDGGKTFFEVTVKGHDYAYKRGLYSD